jgi:histidine phosphotransferase ChpT
MASLDLAALLCSRVCHDVIGPVGAIMNGLEMLDSDQDEDMRTVAMDLIKKSAASASARLQFCRLAFGAAGSLTAAIDTGDAEKVARALIANERTALRWNGQRMLVPKNAVKLLLNMCLIASSAVPRGGVITVELEGEGEDLIMRIEATGTNVRLPQVASLLLTGGSIESIDGHSIQPYYTMLLAKECETVVRVSTSPESVSLTVPARAGDSDQAELKPGCNADTATYAFSPDSI